MPRSSIPLKEVPHQICDASKTKSYTRGVYLGKGGFARCYALTDEKTKAVVAGKVVSKMMLLKQKNSKEKNQMVQEIKIHRALSHKHVVKLIDYFEDNDNVYVILELCARRSLMELHQRRRGITEPEARYFTYQIAEATEYMHNQKVIHRDLKLGNIFINEEMQLKVGDFGLATTVDGDEQRKTLCGTPNYIAPEVLNKSGHSYEVDIWAIGCILFTLLVGKPPFETATIQETSRRIKQNLFTIPCWVSNEARSLIKSLLANDPKQRPPTDQVRTHSFFKGYMPERLPTSSLTMAPNFTAAQLPPCPRCACCKPPAGGFPSPTAPKPLQEHNGVSTQEIQEKAVPSDYHLPELYDKLSNLLNSSTLERNLAAEDICEAPEAQPVYYVSKWVDYTDKYAFGYELSDRSLGVLFNDRTKLILDAAGLQLARVNQRDQESFYNFNKIPDNDADLTKKVKLLHCFRNYMHEHLLAAGRNTAPKKGDDLARLPSLRHWFRTESAVVFHLTNGTVQINFVNDHIKLILCPLMGAVSILDSHQNLRTLSLALLKEHGCTQELYEKLRKAKKMCEKLTKHYSEARC